MGSGRMPVDAWVIGEGDEAERHAAAWARLGERVALRRAVDVGEALGSSPRAVSLCVPLAAREAAIDALLRGGAHVLASSPVAADEAGATRLLATAREARRQLVPAHPILYTPGLLRLMAFVYGRHLGPVQNAHSYAHGPAAACRRFEPTGADEDAALTGHAAIVRTLCLVQLAKIHGGAAIASPEGTRFDVTMYYPDDIVANVRLDPDHPETRRGVVVTFEGGVVRWERDDDGEHLGLAWEGRERRLPLGTEEPHTALAAAFLRTVMTGAPPYEDAQAARRVVELRETWRRLPPTA